MGYTTRFKGSLRIEPQPKKELVEMINNFSKTRHDEKDFPGIWCQWIISGGDFRRRDGNSCFYESSWENRYGVYKLSNGIGFEVAICDFKFASFPHSY